MKKWSLNKNEVIVLTGGSYSKSRGKPSETTRGLEITLMHQPTGIQITGKIPQGKYTREQAGKLREQLVAELYPKLEQLVAKHLHISGR